MPWLWWIGFAALICGVLYMLFLWWLRDTNKRKAILYLESIRKGGTHSPSPLFLKSLLYDRLKVARLTLKDIGTDIDELKTIQARIATELLLRYREVLEEIRCGKVSNKEYSEMFSDCVRSFVERSLISFEYIKTDEVELSLWERWHRGYELSVYGRIIKDY